MTRRETLGWLAAFVLSVALLAVYEAPVWAFAFFLVVSVLFVAAERQPPGRLKLTRLQVLDESGGRNSILWLRFLLPLVGFGIAAVRGDGQFVVFGVLMFAVLVLALLVLRVFGTEPFEGPR